MSVLRTQLVSNARWEIHTYDMIGEQKGRPISKETCIILYIVMQQYHPPPPHPPPTDHSLLNANAEFIRGKRKYQGFLAERMGENLRGTHLIT